MYSSIIDKRLISQSFYIAIIFFFYSCVQDISQPENQPIEIVNTSIDLDRCSSSKQLFIQVETNQQKSQELIQNVFVELNYIGDNIHIYNKTFQLYDNAINGDLIPANGIYTLLAHADTVLMPDIDPELISIDMPDIFQLHQTEVDTMDISSLIYGKAFNAKTIIVDEYNMNIEDSKIVNLDNSIIIIEINSDFMYDGKENNNVCEWNQISNKDSTNFWHYTEFNNSGLLEEDSNTFELFTKIPFNSIEDCGGTGKAFFRFILIDCYTEKSDTINNVLTIYGCGDGVCESSLEDTSSCPGDCQ